MAVRTSLVLPRRGLAVEAVLAVLGGLMIGLSTGATRVGGPPLPVAAGGSAALVVLLLLLRRTAPMAPFAVGAVLAAFSPAVTSTMLITSYAVGRYERRWQLRTAAGIAGFLALAQPWGVDGLQPALGAAVSAALLVLLPGAVGALVATRADLLAALRGRAERAEAERELMAREAVLSERARIAREMHDAVGHRVSLMVLQAGAIEMAAADRDRVEQLACTVQSAGRQALDELRQMVGVLRGSDVDEEPPLGPQLGLEDLPRLVEQAREAGMDVDLRGTAGGEAVEAGIGRAAYRIVQEALTNSGRHAPGAPVRVDVERHPDELLVRVVNGAGAAPTAPVPGGGYGLVGLGERVRTLGGRLRAEPRLDGGFVVEAVLPT